MFKASLVRCAFMYGTAVAPETYIYIYKPKFLYICSFRHMSFQCCSAILFRSRTKIQQCDVRIVRGEEFALVLFVRSLSMKYFWKVTLRACVVHSSSPRSTTVVATFLARILLQLLKRGLICARRLVKLIKKKDGMMLVLYPSDYAQVVQKILERYIWVVREEKFLHTYMNNYIFAMIV